MRSNSRVLKLKYDITIALRFTYVAKYNKLIINTCTLLVPCNCQLCTGYTISNYQLHLHVWCSVVGDLVWVQNGMLNELNSGGAYEGSRLINFTESAKFTLKSSSWLLYTLCTFSAQKIFYKCLKSSHAAASQLESQPCS